MSGSARSRSGFTLLEVMIAMGIFLAAMLAVSGLYFQNLKLARMAQEEIVLSMIQRDVMARNLVVASARAGAERLYARDGNLPSTYSTPFSKFGDPGDDNSGTTVLEKGWGVRNIAAWEASSDMTWGRSTPALASDVPLYTGFCFSVVPVVRAMHDPPVAEDWTAGSSATLADGVTLTPGLHLEDSQFTDFDGYGLVDMDGDGKPETDRDWVDLNGNGVHDNGEHLGPYPSPGLLMDDAMAACDYKDSPFRLFYNSNKMSRYTMKLRVRVMWNVRGAVEDAVTKTDAEIKAAEDAGDRLFSHTEYYFSAFNSDVVKRWRP